MVCAWPHRPRYPTACQALDLLFRFFAEGLIERQVRVAGFQVGKGHVILDAPHPQALLKERIGRSDLLAEWLQEILHELWLDEQNIVQVDLPIEP